MDKGYNVLLIDDREDFTKTFKEAAQQHNIFVASRTNYDDMVECLPKIKDRLSTIILDIKCLKQREQEIESQDFLAMALEHLNQKYADIPRLIVTADSAKYDDVKQWFSKEKIYRKTKDDIEKVFEIIKKNGEEIQSIKVRYNYCDVFEIFDKGYLSSNAEKDLLDLLINMNNEELTEIKKNLSVARRMQEEILQTLHKCDSTIIPESCLKPNKDIKFHSIHKHLSGNKTKENFYKPTTQVYYDGLIECFSDAIYSVTSDNGAHNPYEKPTYIPTKYTVLTVTNALLDFLLWFKGIMKKNKII